MKHHIQQFDKPKHNGPKNNDLKKYDLHGGVIKQNSYKQRMIFLKFTNKVTLRFIFWKDFFIPEQAMHFGFEECYSILSKSREPR
jgi:hypothetical protein